VDGNVKGGGNMNNNKKASWYVVTVIMKCLVNRQPTIPGEWRCTQSIYLLRAVSSDDAYDKAITLGKDQENSYNNSDGEAVDWEFVGLENVEELSQRSISNNIEVWGRVFSSNDPSALTVSKEGLSIYYDEMVKDIAVENLLDNEPESRLVCNRVSYE
jgi:hypothetical protein